MSIFSKQPKGWRVHSLKRRKILKKRPKIKKSGILAVIVFIFLISSIFFIITIGSISRNLPTPDKLLERQVPQSTKIYDRTGKNLLYEFFAAERRTIIPLKDIPRDLINAALVVEDRDFYKHQGFNWRGITRAILMNILNLGKVQGGSTITQQFIKNALLTNEKSYIRKIKELILAYQIEKKFSKDEILQMYFNEIPYGANAYGAEAASKLYFGKSARDLTLDESALLAALPKAPSYYSPYGKHLQELVQRKNWILSAMAELGYLDEKKAQAAKDIDTLKKIIPRRENIVAPHFVMYVRDLLYKKYGEDNVTGGGLKVIASIDLEKQKIAEEEITKQAEINEKNYNASNAALIAINAKTGEILAMVGSKDYFGKPSPEGCQPGVNCRFDPNVNVATSPRQPGSSFKPIVYSAAFQKGYTPDTILFDVETNFGPSGPGKDYIPHNYDAKERGPVTIRQALAGSLNIPAVKTIYLAGVNNVINLAQKFGYTTLTDPSRFGLSLVLGGAEVKLLEHTMAFGSLAREGKKINAIAILKVEDSNGKTLEEFKSRNISEEEIIPAQVARQITDILSDNQTRAFIFGANSLLILPDRPVAAKTGTTNDWRDGWTIGYTPSLVCGVWVGNSDNAAMKFKSDGVIVAAPIWHNFMNRALINTPIERFNAPAPVITDKPVLNGQAGEMTIKIDKATNKLATILTPESYIIEKKYRTWHEILYYLDKDNPLGQPPEHPENDPQFNRWEEGVKKWMSKNKLSNEMPPTQYDDLHVPENQPMVNIISPNKDEWINSELMIVNISANAPRGVSRLECFVDEKLADSNYSPNLNCEINTTGLNYGEHTLKAIAYDNIDNSGSASIKFNISNQAPQKIIWLNPQNNQIIYRENFPLNISILTPAISIDSISFKLINPLGEESAIADINSPNRSGKFTLNWQGGPNGNYKLKIEALDTDNHAIPADEINIEIK
ncbi:MAG: PBP1A family penicillin-binding protein [Patescibacteria group bacterium]